MLSLIIVAHIITVFINVTLHIKITLHVIPYTLIGGSSLLNLIKKQIVSRLLHSILFVFRIVSPSYILPLTLSVTDDLKSYIQILCLCLSVSLSLSLSLSPTTFDV